MVLQQNDYAFAEISTYLDLNSDNTFGIFHIHIDHALWKKLPVHKNN